MNNKYQHFGIVGAGAWGTALAATLMRAGRDVTLWAHEADVVSAINFTHKNETWLPGIALDTKLKATNDLAALGLCDALILVPPAQHLHGLAQKAAKLAKKDAPVVIASKGIETGTGEMLSNIVAKEMPGHEVAVLSGPSFAIEVARGLPTALTLAVHDKGIGEALAVTMATPAFRLYLTDDLMAAQIGGAVKNVLAIACGIVTGRQMGENARAALITRGLAEMVRLGMAVGGRGETLMGLSGLGDLVLTASATQSRNFSLGLELGKGRDLADILAGRVAVTEGVTTAAAALALAQKLKVDMPIVKAIDAVLNKKADIQTEIAALLARPLKAEGA